jgi:methyltransferase (TIGR00027 family)
MTAPPVQDVSETALMVAVWRARENERPNPLYRDPLALKLAGPRGQEIVSSLPRMRAAAGAWMMAVRTRIIDDLVHEAVGRGVDTVVNLGAGLDTRPYRLDLPRNLRWVEVDYPKILELKAQRLADEKPLCSLKRISCDLTDPLARRALLSEVAHETRNGLILTEGVIPYLTNDEVGALADALRAHPGFRSWIADYFSPFVRKYRQRQTRSLRMQNAEFRFDPHDYFEFFGAHGWRPTKVCWIHEEARRLGRNPPALMWALWRLRGLFMSAARRAQMRRAIAYVLFAPGGASSADTPPLIPNSAM